MTIFRSRRRPEAEAEYQVTAAAMYLAASSMPGFVDYKTFRADDGEQVSLVTFDSPETHRAWREDPRHRAAQQQGRDQFYVDYSIQVGECQYVSQWSRDERS